MTATSSHRRQHFALGLAAFCALTVLGPGIAIGGADTSPPAFGGLRSAVTCLPGPAGPGRESSYRLAWDAATDDFSPTRRIVYDIYQATSSGGEDLSSPTYTTAHGATTFQTPLLPSDRTFWFIVRARDRAGNSDTNKVERQGVNVCV